MSKEAAVSGERRRQCRTRCSGDQGYPGTGRADASIMAVPNLPTRSSEPVQVGPLQSRASESTLGECTLHVHHAPPVQSAMEARSRRRPAGLTPQTAVIRKVRRAEERSARAGKSSLQRKHGRVGWRPAGPTRPRHSSRGDPESPMDWGMKYPEPGRVGWRVSRDSPGPRHHLAATRKVRRAWEGNTWAGTVEDTRSVRQLFTRQHSSN